MIKIEGYEVKDLGHLESPPENPQPGNYYTDPEGKQWMCSLDGSEWLCMDIDSSMETGITNYELNKMVVAQMPSLTTPEQLAPVRETIEEYFDRPGNKRGYFMLLCNDLHYYTVFNRVSCYEASPDDYVEDILIECLQDVGFIQLVDYDHTGNNLECWVKNSDGVFMFLLFNYSWGVVRCR